MKHIKLIGTLATAGSLFAMSSAHAFAPAIAAGLAALAGAAVGSTAAQSANTPPAVAVVPAAPTVAVVPDNTVVMGAGPVVQEVVPAPRDGYQWQRGHFELQNGASVWMPGHWVSNDVTIYESN